MKIHQPFSLFLLIIMLASLPSRGALILSDNFNYGTNLATVGASGSPWANHSGTAGTSLIWTNQLRVTFSGTEDINAPLFGAPYTTNDLGSLYASFSLSCYQFPTLVGGYIAHFRGTNSGAATDFGARLWVSATNTVVTNSYRLGIGNGTLADAFSGQFARDLASNEVVKVVIRFTPSTGDSTLWLDPASESDPSVTATDIGTATRPNAFNVFTFAFRQGGGHGAHLIDDLKVGTTFNDVAGPDSPPSVGAIPNQTIPASTSTLALPFQVSDDNTAAGDLVLGKSSSNPTLVPVSGIVFGGAGSNRTVTITPAVGQQGVATIFYSATDNVLQSATNSFIIRVGAPTVSPIAHQVTRVNVGVTNLSFTVFDAEGDTLTVTPSSDNLLVVDNSGIVVGGVGTNRTITVTPVSAASGVANITLSVSDASNTNLSTFAFQVMPVTGQFFSDRFDRADGPLVDGNGIWNFHSGAVLGELQIVSNRVQITSDQSEDVNAAFPAGPNSQFSPSSGAILFASFSVSVRDLPTNSGTYFVHFKDDGTSNFRARVFARTNAPAPGKYRLGLANGGGSPNVEFPADLDTNVTYRCVLSYNTFNNVSRLWVEPYNEKSLHVTATDPTSGILTSSFALRQGVGLGTLFLDNLRVGGAFNDVAPYLPLQTDVITNNVLRFSWPTGGSAQLQGRPSVATGPWTNLLNAVTTVGGISVVTVTNMGGSNYYRLISP